MANIINGKEISAAIRAEIKEATERLVAESGVRPGLAVIIVGEDPASQVYVRNKKRACDEVGFYSEPHILPENVTTEEVIKVIREAGGVAVLAHPHHQAHLVGELVDMGLNGIEVCHPDLDEETSRAAAEAADAYRLYRSGGTDHTGPMSACGGDLAVPAFHGATEEEFFTIKERKLG